MEAKRGTVLTIFFTFPLFAVWYCTLQDGGIFNGLMITRGELCLCFLFDRFFSFQMIQKRVAFYIKETIMHLNSFCSKSMESNPTLQRMYFGVTFHILQNKF